MEAFYFLLNVLAVWRVTHLLSAEDGPFDLIFKLRKLAGNSVAGKLMDCFYCLSIWVAAPPGFYFGNSWSEKIILWLALSASAIIIQNLFMKNNSNPQH